MIVSNQSRLETTSMHQAEDRRQEGWRRSICWFCLLSIFLEHIHVVRHKVLTITLVAIFSPTTMSSMRAYSCGSCTSSRNSNTLALCILAHLQLTLCSENSQAVLKYARCLNILCLQPTFERWLLSLPSFQYNIRENVPLMVLSLHAAVSLNNSSLRSTTGASFASL